MLSKFQIFLTTFFFTLYWEFNTRMLIATEWVHNFVL
ncbi:unnamed protein product [Larinioides sclopetarius]|uniref:Uncharacterized protein n=1 Tax=Larinioides sclopetarius TaxID=280406 RepID=A0AAV2B244_9ARAC